MAPKEGLAAQSRLPAMRCKSFLCNGSKGNSIANASNLVEAAGVGAIVRVVRLKCFPNHMKLLDGMGVLLDETSKPTSWR